MFGIRNLSQFESHKVVEFNDPNPVIIQGAEIFDTLCPVSKLTGVRENPVSLLSRVLDPAKARALDSVLQQLPTMRNEDPNMSDEDALDMCMARLETGTPAEDALVAERLASIADVLFVKPVQAETEQKINFSETETPSTE